MQSRQAGFTLIELMIVVAIIGILAAIAYPAYTSYVQRGNRAIAKTILVEIASRQESYLSDRKSYADALEDDLGYPANTFYVDREGNMKDVNTGAIYTITLAGAATAFTVTATATGNQAGDTKCASLSLTNTGAKTSTGGGTDCWSR